MEFEDQDLHRFLEAYRREYPDDVLEVGERLPDGQDVTALAFELWARGRAPIIQCRVQGVEVPIVTNLFASRERLSRILGTRPGELHRTFAEKASRALPPRVVGDGPVLAVREDDVDLTRFPMIRHFEQDAGPYLTSAVVIAEDPEGRGANASYHRCMLASPTSLATSLHSRGHLWRYLQAAAERRQVLPVAVVVGGHPLFLLACAARVGIEVDERAIAGGLFGRPLDVVPTPRYRIGVPASSDYVLEGFIDPEAFAPEGPFGEFSGYASARSTNNLITVETVLRREDPLLLDIVSGHSPDHLNLGRLPREADLLARLQERYPEVVALHFPPSGTHFHCYVSVRPRVPGLARQVLLALLGLDPYVKLAVAVDDDVDPTDEAQVLWAVATRFQADRDLLVVSGVPGSLLDPSAEGGRTARMGLDATRGPGFEGQRVSLPEASVRRARRLLGGEPAEAGSPAAPTVI